jgi:hypothetical protein
MKKIVMSFISSARSGAVFTFRYDSDLVLGQPRRRYRNKMEPPLLLIQLSSERLLSSRRSISREKFSPDRFPGGRRRRTPKLNPPIANLSDK